MAVYRRQHKVTVGQSGCRRGALLALLSLCLAGCLNLQLGGSVTGATVTITPLRDPSNIIQQLEAPSLSATRDLFGDEAWDAAPDLFRMIFLGNVTVDPELYADETLYLVTASGGLDQDADTDQAIDDAPVAVTGQWHAILAGSQLRAARLSPLTEAAYRYLELNLDALNDEEVLAELNRIAPLMVANTNGDGKVDYLDVLWWNRSINANTFLRDLVIVDELAEAIRTSASAADLRELSAAVIGDDAQGSGPFFVSGSITVSATTRVDSDVNNPDAQFESNDTFARAQTIINPVTLGGYANLPGEGSSGSSTAFGDFDDFYRADLLAGQRVTLVMAEDPTVNDLDLYLYDASTTTLVDLAIGVAEVEQITVPADGEYYIGVSAFEGASNYQLTIGIGELQPELEAQQLRLSDDFVPGQVIARFRDRQDARQLQRSGRLRGMRVRGGGVGRSNLLELEDSDARQGDWLQRRKQRTLFAVKEMRRRSDVDVAALNYYVRPMAVPNDVYYNSQRWHYEMINLPQAWERSLGDDVVVAVIDTGIRQNHPDLAGQLVPGFDFVSSLSQAGDGNGIDANPEDPGDSDTGAPSSFHGTHVAGTVAAASNNTQGVAGVAWNARIMPLRALGVGGGTSYDVRQAVLFAAGLDNDSGTTPAQPADVINLSLAGGGFSTIDQQIFNQIADLGIVVVAAAGNESSSQFSYPASYDDVISVSAVNINKARANYSNFGSRIDVAAPGGDSFTRDVNGDGVSDLILSTSADDSNPFSIQDSYALLQGTSMATPHVAGVVALMKSIYPALTGRDFENLLEDSLITDDLGSAGRDNTFGWGLINANKAVLVAESLASGSDILNEPRVSASASSLNFGNFADALPLTISNGGTGLLQDIEVVIGTGSPWLSVNAVSVNSEGVGAYEVRVDRDQLAVGSYSASILVSSGNGGETSILVIAQQPDPGTLTDGDAGFHYILLVNADNQSLACQASTNVIDGNYPFEFQNVPPGRYQIFGGSDADNDLFICDPGEACGAWPVFDVEPVVIDVRQNLSGLSFASTFSTDIIEISSSGDSPARRPIRRSGYRGGAKSAGSVDGAAIQVDCSGKLAP